MTVMNALNGLVSDLLDRLAEKVAGTDRAHVATRDKVGEYLQDPAAGRTIIAKMARSEVKNYLAELAELCEMPYTSPEGLIQALRTSAFVNLQKLETPTGFVTMTPAEFADLQYAANAHAADRTCDDLGHDPRIHSPNGQAEIAREKDSQ